MTGDDGIGRAGFMTMAMAMAAARRMPTLGFMRSRIWSSVHQRV
jgi:hypothetical protein